MKKLIIIFFLLFFAIQGKSEAAILSGIFSGNIPIPTYNGFYHYKCLNGNTTVTGANVSSTQSNFPIAVHINSSSWSTAGDRTHFFNDTYNPNGKRIRFYASDKTTVLSYEVEYYSTSGQEAIYWVKVPTVTGNNANSNMVCVYYGNDPNGSDQSTVGGAWDANYVGIWHLGDNYWLGNGAGQVLDATNVNNGTNTSTADDQGIVRRGRKSTKDNVEYINVGSNASLNTTTNMTITLWYYPAGLYPAYAQTLFSRYQSGSPYAGYSFTVSDSATQCNDNTKLGFFDGTSWKCSTTAAVATTTWGHIGVVHTGTTSTVFYKNGAAFGSTTANTIPTYSGNALIGKDPTSDTIGAIGTYDEIRVSNIARTADWIKLEYYSMRYTVWNGDSWITWGSEQ